MKHIISATILLLMASLFAEVNVTNISTRSHWPWSGKIDITYSLECEIQDAKLAVDVSGYDNVLQKELTATSLSGDGIGGCLTPGGPYTTTWDVTADYPRFHGADMKVTVDARVVSFAVTVDGVTRHFLPGETVSVTAEEKEGRTFVGWTVEGIVLDSYAPQTLSFSMPANDVSLSANYVDTDTLYMVVNLESGESRYSAVAPNLSDDTCRTTELWLRRIPAGTFMMGSPEDEVGRRANETQHLVTLTQDYYIGIFEMTQRQYELITGEKPSYFNNAACYAGRPVEQVSYDMIRGVDAGAGWPSSHDVDEDSFLGKLREKIGLIFDLPTEAQWEYACRAGTTTSLNTGKNLVNPDDEDDNLNEAGRNWYNGGFAYSPLCDTSAGTAQVGSFLPNAWGLYDMHGNVAELCLDWRQDDLAAVLVFDPVGAQSISSRIVRGGSFYQNTPPGFCRSAKRNSCYPNKANTILGFRVVSLLESNLHSLTFNGKKLIKRAGDIVSMSAEKEGHSFIGWTEVVGVEIPDTSASFIEFTMPDKDVILTANYSVNGYTLTVDGIEEVVSFGSVVSKTASDRDGKTFGGWWNVSGITGIENTQTISLTMPANDVSMDSYYYDNGEYLVVNLETGENRVSNIPPDLSDDTCRTTELWLRKIPAGTFMMGSLEDEVGQYYFETQHQVTLTQDYYIGVFEMTQRQYELITGRKPSYFNNASCYATRPVEYVSYDMIRGSSLGAGWPANNNVDSTSFLGILRTKTGLTFDLPTEGQWEYACRAGTTTSLNTGKNVVNASSSDANLNEAGRNRFNSGSSYSESCDTTAGTAKVGSYLPNAWGLYDMHGNVYEWCLDWFGSYTGNATDPTGAQAGSNRVLRGGGCFNADPQYCRSAFRFSYFNPSIVSGSCGFRVVCLYDSDYHIVSVNGEKIFKEVGTVVVIDAEKEGHTLVNWSVVSGVDIPDTTASAIEFTMPDNDVILVANYSVNNYALFLDGIEEQVAFGSTVSKSASVKDGKVFVEWTVDGIVLDNYVSPALSFVMPANDVRLTTKYVETGILYFVVNLESGESHFSSMEPNLSDDICRTTELWLRHIPAGTFLMGSPSDEAGRREDEPLHWVTLTQDYYIGIFEITQRQYELITGDKPSYHNNTDCYAPRPVEQVTYDMIRGGSSGACWPSSHNVDGTSFLGKLHDKTGLIFDLPTEAQWERACRAGTTTSLNTGKNVVNLTSYDANLNETGRNWFNGGSTYSSSRDSFACGTAKVGSYLPNAWGVYDMHGNVREWCLDWYEDNPGSAIDPVGIQLGYSRVVRGGSVRSYPNSCRAAYRVFYTPSSLSNERGFRVVWFPNYYHVVSVNGTKMTKKDGEKVSVTAEDKEGYTFSNWTVAGITVEDATANPLEFTMPSNDVSLVANYTVNNYTLTVDGVSELVVYGASVSKNAPVKEGNTFMDWTVDGVQVDDKTTTTIEFTMPASDVSLTSNYSINSYALTVDGVSEPVAFGTSVSKTASTKEGKTFKDWTVDGVQVDDKTTTTIEFTMPAGDVSLRSNYSINSYALTVDGVSEQVAFGTSVSKTAPAKEGNTFKEWTVDGVQIADKTIATIKFSMPACNVTLVANYTVNNYKLTVEGTAEQVAYGASVSKTAPVKEGNTFKDWTVTGVSVDDTTANPLQFTMPACNVTLVANYTVNNYKLTVEGTAEQVAYGASVSKTAPAKEGKTFKDWTVEGVSVDDTAANLLQFTMPARNVKLTPNYTVNSYTLTVDGVSEQVSYGASVSKTASAKEGNTFKDWTVDGVQIVDKTVSTITFTMPANDVTLAANYTVNGCKLTVDGVEEYVVPGETVSVTAREKEGMTFVGWTVDGIVLGSYALQALSFTMPANEVTLTSNYVDTETLYLVVNLESGENRYSSVAPDLSDDTCRTTELWLRRIPKGTFIMGSPEGEVGRKSSEPQHQVTLTQDYYIGIFEMTQRQYELITGAKPSYFNNASYYATRPVEQVSYNMIRGSSVGAGWPSSHDVDSVSFLGKLRLKAGLTFDLPTEAQWEYACRAGTTTSLNTGKNVVNPSGSDTNLNEAGRNWYNGGSAYSQTCGTTAGTAKVGSYLPNAWGLYDMHGNVLEWCLDWLYSDYNEDTDPVGAQSGSYRLLRSGCWGGYDLKDCRAASHFGGEPSCYNNIGGFRVVCLVDFHTVNVDGEKTNKKAGEAVSVTAEAKEGYSFTNWTVSGVDVADKTVSTITFTMPVNDVSLFSCYSVNSYTLTVDGVEEQVFYGSTVTKTAPNDEGKAFKDWAVTGVQVADATVNPLSFTMPANDVTLVSYYQAGGTYLVVYLEDNAQAGVKAGDSKYTDTAPDLSDDNCRTAELWLRRIPKGTFTMGSPDGEVGRKSSETQHQVTLTQDYYIGVFEVTQRQYELITGAKPSYFNNASYYTTRPVEQVSYNMIRGSSVGTGWPANNNVDSESFLGKLRNKTSLTFDLPTEAQWEYACRAGTTTSLNTGKNMVNPESEDANLNEAGRNVYNGGSSNSQTCDTSAGTAKVGSYLPNSWGLYDMHGNVWEWCLDWYASYAGEAIDPAGAQSGVGRVARGGGCVYDPPWYCRSADRNYSISSRSYINGGFRVVCLP